ncbi:MAG: hypothetical protein IH597_00645 [Bacteroidales bacterium]|nr:hypothetical protein [Bacteroidales bacterium]
MKLSGIFFGMLFLFYGSINGQITGTMTDSRDGKIYKTVKIGKQNWTAQNMNHENPNSWCYNNEPSNCENFGRLYSYVGAAQACPPGWRLPTSKDWKKLIEDLGEESAATRLRDGGGTGFNALMAGVRYDHGGFNHLNENGYFWSHVVSDNETAMVFLIARTMHSVTSIHSFSGNGFSVRCIRR